MKKEYDFSKGRRGLVVPLPSEKMRITIRLDGAIINWFRKQVEKQGGGNYQTMINNALRDYIKESDENLGDLVNQAVLEALSKFQHTNLTCVSSASYTEYLKVSDVASNDTTRDDLSFDLSQNTDMWKEAEICQVGN